MVLAPVTRSPLMPGGDSTWASSGRIGKNQKGMFEPLRFKDVPLPAKKNVLVPEEIAAHRGFQSTCVMFTGRRGQGKSLSMTATAMIQKRRYQHNQSQFLVAANYAIHFADYQSPYLVEELTEFPEWGRDLYCCVDEVSSSFPSRRSMSRVNLNFSTWLQQIRKRRCEVAFTTQFPQVMDIQLLLQVDLFIRCVKHLEGKACELFIYDYWGQWTGLDFRKPWPPETGSHDWVVRYNNLDKIWPLYNTNDIVRPLWSKDRDKGLRTDGWQLDDESQDPLILDNGVYLTQPKEETFESWLEGLPDGFNVAAQVTKAKKFNPTLTTKGKLAAYLEGNGYHVTKGKDTWRAYLADDPDFQKEVEVRKS